MKSLLSGSQCQGDELRKEKSVIFIYRLTPQDAAGIMNAYGSKYDVIDSSDCFEDLIAISAAIVFINPKDLTKKQFDLLEECFRYEETTSLVFSYDPDKKWHFIYYVDEDLANARITWENVYDNDALEEKYIEVEKAKNIFLNRIDLLICGPEKYKSTMDKIVTIEKNCHLYEYINKILENMSDIPPREKVQYREDVCASLDIILETFHIEKRGDN